MMTSRRSILRSSVAIPRVAMVQLLLLLAAAGTIMSAFALEVATLPIPTLRLDLTIQSGGDRRRLGEARDLLDSIDSTIQSVAERHLASVYAEQFEPNVPPPTQVLLTVATADDEDASRDSSGGGGIYIRSSFLGGVASFPVTPADAPSRKKMERVTLNAFRIPGAAGERFLEALKAEDHPDLRGLLLVGVVEVDGGGYFEGDGYLEDNPTVAQPSVKHDDGGGSSMNIWAVAAVAALGAMFLVIVLCTSILYCDWRKRKNRREKRHQQRMAANHGTIDAGNDMAVNVNRYSKKNSSSNKNKSSNGYADLEAVETRFDEDVSQPPSLQMVVPPAASGETEMMALDTPSPSSQGSGENSQDQVNKVTVHTSNTSGGGHHRGSSFLGMMRSRAMSKRAGAQLDLAEASEQLSPISSPSPKNINNEESVTDDEYAVAEITEPNDNYSVGEDTTALFPSVNRGRTYSRDKDTMSDFDGYSMDGMSAADVAGFSQYGGSAGGSGSGIGSGRKGSSRDMYYAREVPRDFDSVWGDDDQSRLTTDMSMDNGAIGGGRYSGMAGDVHSSEKEAYGDLTKNLDELVEQQYEEQSKGSSAASKCSGQSPLGSDADNAKGGDHYVSSVNAAHEFDSESESGSNRGAFTLQLLGGGEGDDKDPTGKSAAGGGATSNGGDDEDEDEDSILGGLYKDDEEIISVGGGEEGGGANELARLEDDKENLPSTNDGDSVDSTPSWAAPIQSALRRSTAADIFRTSARGSDEGNSHGINEEERKNASALAHSKKDVSSRDENDAASSSSRESQERRTKEKLLSSLGGLGSVASEDNGSVGSRGSNGNRSQGSVLSTKSTGSGRSAKSNGSNRSSGGSDGKSVPAGHSLSKHNDKTALGPSNSAEEEVDDCPEAMIDGINSMLSECREILDSGGDSSGADVSI